MTFTNTDCVGEEVYWQVENQVDDQFDYQVWNQVDDQVFLIYPIRYKILQEMNK